MTESYKTIGHLERILSEGKFVITAELTPPDSANPQEVYDEAAMLANSVDAFNATDGSGAHCHMSSISICSLLTRQGYPMVMQISCRDRNRIAIQGDVLGAAAMGVSNILCISGDDVTAGDQPEAKRVFDFDSIQLLRTIRLMRDKEMFLSGRKLTEPLKMFLGAASNPFMPPYDWRALRLAKKIEAGANFIQSQYCYDVPMLRTFMRQCGDLGLHDLVYYLVGVGPIRSVKTAEYMRTKVPGVHIPDEIVDRLRKTPQIRQREEGKRICVEIIEQVKEIEGVDGLHIMAYKQQELIPEIVEEAGLLPRPARDQGDVSSPDFQGENIY